MSTLGPSPCYFENLMIDVAECFLRTEVPVEIRPTRNLWVDHVNDVLSLGRLVGVKYLPTRL